MKKPNLKNSKPDLPRHFEDSRALNQWVREYSGDTCLLAFSCGKDSIAAWIEVNRYFDKVIPFYKYLVPGLEFVEESLAYYEKTFGTKIIQMPHPSLYRWLNNLTFQAPENCAIVERANLPEFNHPDVERVVKEDLGLPLETYTAVGVRAVDSPMRWASIKTHGAVNHKNKNWYPVYDWRIDKLKAEVEQADIKLPVDYAMFGRSFDGLDYRFLKPIKENFPRDYAKILELFPLVDLELFRAEMRMRNQSKAAA